MVKKDNDNNEDKENEDLPLLTYEQYLRENGLVLLNVGDVDPVF